MVRLVKDFDAQMTKSRERETSGVDDLFRLHGSWLRMYLLRRLRAQPADVEDIVQETYLRAASQPGRMIVHPKAFLSQTALNLFRDGKRRESVRARHRNSVEQLRAGAGAGPPGLLEQEATVELERIVLDLPEKMRDVFVLSRFRHMSNVEIAAALGISVKTVEWRMGKALALCMSSLRD
ncbi:RNA polymerase sigma factor [Sphingomonas sp. PL20]|uniref:RNA polymerase sigma factor n=1 Tax=Sphingomonas sp. PL20 TaxID=2760712 RepID=UPI001AE4B596